MTLAVVDEQMLNHVAERAMLALGCSPEHGLHLGRHPEVDCLCFVSCHRWALSG